MKRRSYNSSLLAAALLLSWAALPAPARAQLGAPPPTPYVPDELKNVQITEHTGSVLPLDLVFHDEQGRDVPLRQFFTGRKPVILQMGYLGCPMLCGLISHELLDSVKKVSLNAGADYEFVFVSIDASETPRLAQEKRQAFQQDYGRADAGGWHFLTGDARSIARLSEATGFNFKWVESVRQFSHPAALMICSPDGKLTRYLYGVRFEPETLKLSLVEASNGKVGSATDQLFLTCFQYDGHQGKYAFAAMGLMRAGGILTMLAVGTVLIRMFRREHHGADQQEFKDATGV